MKKRTVNGLVGGLLASFASFAPATAQAYCIDHAILLCMAGGFPANAVCNQAKSVMIARVTPIPSTPPLQLWRCPLSASLNRQNNFGGNQIIKAAYTNLASFPGVIKAQASLTDEFDFVNELRVIYGTGFNDEGSDRRSPRWQSSIRVCDNTSRNCVESRLGTGLGGGENGDIGVPQPIGPDYVHHSTVFDRSVSIKRTTGRAIALLYWDNDGNPTLTDWIRY